MVEKSASINIGLPYQSEFLLSENIHMKLDSNIP